MQIKDAMCRDFKLINPGTTLKEAAKLMSECECGYLPVGENDRLTGAVTDRDIVVRGIAEGQNPDKTAVSKVMTGKIVYCFEDDDITEAAGRMKKEQIRRLAVLNRNKRMTGIISLGDIARMSNDNQLIADIEKGVAKAA